MLSPAVPLNLSTSATGNSDKVLKAARAVAYPGQVWALLGGFIAFLAILNILSYLPRLFPRRWVLARSGHGFSPALRPAVALVNGFRIIAFRITIAPMHLMNFAEVFLTTAYMTALLAWAFARSVNVEGQFDPKYWANIVAHIAASQVTLVVALGTRTNFIATLTGVSFDKLSLLHRMSARTLFVLLWIHAGGRIRINGLTGDDSIHQTWIQCGIFALGALSLLVLISLRPFRVLKYEYFVVAHFVLVLVILVGVYLHLKGAGFIYFAYPPFILWGFDRVFRIVRVLYYNLRVLTSSAPTTIAEAVDEDYLRLTCRLPHFTWLAGQSVFLAVPSISAHPLESHPFTISSIDDASVQGKGGSDEEVAAEGGPRIEGKELVFLIKVRDGFTKRLSDAAADINSGKVKVLVDGPYSVPPILRGYEAIILIAGGSGVSFTLPLFLDAIRKASAQSENKCKIVFLWVLRNPEHICVVRDQLRQAITRLPSHVTVQTQLYITSQPAPSTVSRDQALKSETTSEKEARSTSSGFDDLSVDESHLSAIQRGRPDLETFLQTQTASMTGSISVNVCGPKSMSQDVRKSLNSARIVANALSGGPSISLHVEAFGTA